MPALVLFTTAPFETFSVPLLPKPMYATLVFHVELGPVTFTWPVAPAYFETYAKAFDTCAPFCIVSVPLPYFPTASSFVIAQEELVPSTVAVLVEESSAAMFALSLVTVAALFISSVPLPYSPTSMPLVIAQLAVLSVIVAVPVAPASCAITTLSFDTIARFEIFSVPFTLSPMMSFASPRFTVPLETLIVAFSRIFVEDAAV